MKASGVIGGGSASFLIVKEFEAKKRGIRCAVYCKLLKLTFFCFGLCVLLIFFDFVFHFICNSKQKFFQDSVVAEISVSRNNRIGF